ncbi:MAG TPA: hypothetical protein VFQ72_00580 [Candidatus Paceibacterota bacterium]|nr:hypothetical protein [Candidatus Paceibacterota bacterium]
MATETDIPQSVMNDDILNRSVIVIILGDAVAAESLAASLLAGSSGICHVKMRNAPKPREKSKQLQFAVLLEKTAENFQEGCRLMLVSGFPSTIEDAELVAQSCPHLVTFTKGNPSETQHRIQSTLRSGGQVHVIDPDRSESQQRTFVQNRINAFLASREIAVELDRALAVA